MRDILKELVKNTIILEYELPCQEKGLEKTPLSTHKDKCYNVVSDDSLIDIIYNSIIEYSLNEFDIDKNDYNKSMDIALQTKIRENPNKSHGFFGEVLLHSILCALFKTDVLIARGYFYCPTSKSEVTGFDSYHLIQYGDKVQLWFGEAKFRTKYHQSICEIIKKLSLTISDDYLRSNILAFENHKRNLNLQGSVIEKILDDFRENPKIVIADKLQEYIILPIVKSKDLRHMIEYKGKDGDWKHSLLTYVVAAYLDKGFNGLVEYNVKKRAMSLDDAINGASNFVYNLLKYHLVKYLGAFNLIYKYHIAKIEGISEADVLGFDRLLSKFEYNAFSDKGRLASDYGSTHNIIEYYEHIDDNPNEAAKIRKRFDNFEEKLFNNLEKVLH